MEIISLKSNVRKNASKHKKGLYTNRDSLKLFIKCQFSLFFYKYDSWYSWYPSNPNFHWKHWKNIYLQLDLPNWYNFLVPSAVIFVDMAIWNLPIFNLSVIIFLIPLLPSSSAKASFSNTLLISEKTFYFTTKISIPLCWPIYLRTLKIFSLRLHLALSPAGYRKKFRRRIFSQPQECWVRLVTVTNEPVPRRSTTLFPFSRAKHFFFSTSWKFWLVPIWLKTLNPKRHAAIYRYWKDLDMNTLAKRKWAKSKIQKPFPHKINATMSILVWLQNSNSDIQLSHSSWFNWTS